MFCIRRGDVCNPPVPAFHPEELVMIQRRAGIYLILPAIVIMAVFTVYPLLDGLRIAFTNYNLLGNVVNYVGLQNFRQMVADPIFWLSLRHSIELTVVVVILQLIFGLILASVMQQKLPGMGLFKSIIMASWVIPVAATTTIFRFIAQPDVGITNIFLRAIGQERLVTYWFGNLYTAFPAVMVMHLWRNVPFYAVAFLAAMQAIPKVYYEAAEIDGAGAWSKFRYVTLPGIRSMILVMVTIHVLWTFNNFDFVYLSTGGGPVNSTEVLPTYVYRLSWTQYNIGFASSVGTTMFLILMIYFIVYMTIYERQTAS
jgi:multiple sugar transport system permease protein